MVWPATRTGHQSFARRCSSVVTGLFVSTGFEVGRGRMRRSTRCLPPLDAVLATEQAVVRDRGSVAGPRRRRCVGPMARVSGRRWRGDGSIRYRVLRRRRAGVLFFPAAPVASAYRIDDRRCRAPLALRVPAPGRRRASCSNRRGQCGRVEVHASSGVELVACLAMANTPEQAAERLGQDAAFVEAAIGLLRAASLVLPAADNGETAEDVDAHARGWEFHDLVMHGRSRTFRRDLRVGATYRFGEDGRRARGLVVPEYAVGNDPTRACRRRGPLRP